MKWRQSTQAIQKRMKRPDIWLGCLFYATVTAIPGLDMDMRLDGALYSGYPFLVRLPIQLVGALICAILCPMAWQWTRDERPLGRVGTSLVQLAGISILSWGLFQLPIRAILAPRPAYAHSWICYSSILFEVICFQGLVGWALAWCEHQRELERASLEQVQEAQWTLLRSQLSPHMVLNALNGLAGLTEEDPMKASRGLEDLAEIYKQLLDLGQKERIPLKQERELLERYLGVEKLRLEDALKIEWQWDESLDQKFLPPLLVQPLVENAIKHGVSTSPGGGHLVISARRKGSALLLEVRNTGGRLEPKDGLETKGVGISNLKRRLHLAYGHSASLILDEEGPWTRARILLPTNGGIR